MNAIDGDIYPEHDESMRERWKNFQFGNSPEDVGWCGEQR